MVIYKDAMSIFLLLKDEKIKKDLLSQGKAFLLLRTKGMGEIFHGQTKGYKFVCD
ncbi:hypothetical protein AAHH67_24515 [Niallia circulans]